MEIFSTPNSLDLENALIGAVLLETSAFDSIAAIVDEKTFFEPKNRQIYNAVTALSAANLKVDIYTVAQQLKKVDPSENWGFMLAQLTLKVGSAAHVVSHAKKLKELEVARELQLIGTKLSAMAGNPANDIEHILEFANKALEETNEMLLGGRSSSHIKDVLKTALKEAENRAIAFTNGIPTGISTGLADLNRLTGGWRSGQLIILAARPAMGKTALMLHFAKAAAKAGVPVCVYSLEMSDVSLANRLIISECNIEPERFRAGNFDANDWKALNIAEHNLAKLPIYIDDNPVVSMRYIQSHSRVMAKKGLCGMVLVDYLQLADVVSESKNRNREQEVAATSRHAKIIAKELKVPFLLLSQLSREVEKRVSKKPMLSDLRESGAIEQDADIVAFIHRPSYYGEETIETAIGSISSEGVGLLFIEKQRDGATGGVRFTHNQSLTKIYDYNNQNVAPF